MPPLDRKAWVETISETTTYANGTSVTTAYAYGLERIAAYHENGVTRYVYDGRGSVAQAVNVSVAGEAVSSNLPDVGVQVQTFSYTAYGEQMGDVKVSGFTYNAETYDAATGMLNLRARQYEPAVGRFGQKDIVRGKASVPLSLNRYVYSFNSAPNCEDPNGLKAKETTYDKFKLEKKKGSAISGYYQLKVGTYLATVMGSQLTSVKSLKEARSQAKRIAAEKIISIVSSVARKYIKAVEEADNFSEAQERADKAVEFMNEYKAYLEPGLQARLKALTTKEKKVKGSKTEKREGVSIARITMCMQLLNDEGVIKTADEAINTYSRLTKDSVLTKTTEEFLDTAAKLEGKPYSEVDCAGLIAQALKKYASYTGMTQMYKNDQVIGGTITSIDQLKALPVGTIVGQMNGSAGSQTATLESGAVVEHGGIVVMHDFGDGYGNVMAIYQSMGNNAGGPTYTKINELGNWNIWFWHDGITN